MSTTSSAAEDHARALELDAHDYPEDRGEVLIEAAHSWRTAGDIDRAVALLEDVVGIGGLDAEYAHYSLADLWFDQGDEEKALAELDSLHPTDSGPAGLVAELLEARGDHASALQWFDRAFDLLEDEERERLGKRGAPSLHATLVHGRRRCREQLGLPYDAIDRLASIQEENRLEFLDLLSNASQQLTHPRARVLVWQRDQQLLAAKRWPDVFTSDIIGHHRDVDQRLRTRAERVATIELVPGDVDEFTAHLAETGGDPGDEEVRLAYSNAVYERGRRIAWPPGRNEPCWCGSLVKYKKCCGAPTNQ